MRRRQRDRYSLFQEGTLLCAKGNTDKNFRDRYNLSGINVPLKLKKSDMRRWRRRCTKSAWRDLGEGRRGTRC